MRVDPKLSVVTTGSTARRPAGRGFTLDTPADEPRAGASGGAAATGLGGIDSLIVLQAEEDPAQRKRRAARRGTDILDTLDTIKAAILSGRIQTADLLRLQGLLAQRKETSTDPRLDEVIAHIELRAAVELAKLGR